MRGLLGAGTVAGAQQLRSRRRTAAGAGSAAWSRGGGDRSPGRAAAGPATCSAGSCRALPCRADWSGAMIEGCAWRGRRLGSRAGASCAGAGALARRGVAGGLPCSSERSRGSRSATSWSIRARGLPLAVLELLDPARELAQHLLEPASRTSSCARCARSGPAPARAAQLGELGLEAGPSCARQRGGVGARRRGPRASARSSQRRQRRHSSRLGARASRLPRHQLVGDVDDGHRAPVLGEGRLVVAGSAGRSSP